jgi:hypothetical protein
MATWKAFKAIFHQVAIKVSGGSTLPAAGWQRSSISGRGLPTVILTMSVIIIVIDRPRQSPEINIRVNIVYIGKALLKTLT